MSKANRALHRAQRREGVRSVVGAKRSLTKEEVVRCAAIEMAPFFDGAAAEAKMILASIADRERAIGKYAFLLSMATIMHLDYIRDQRQSPIKAQRFSMGDYGFELLRSAEFFMVDMPYGRTPPRILSDTSYESEIVDSDLGTGYTVPPDAIVARFTNHHFTVIRKSNEPDLDHEGVKFPLSNLAEGFPVFVPIGRLPGCDDGFVIPKPDRRLGSYRSFVLIPPHTSVVGGDNDERS